MQRTWLHLPSKAKLRSVQYGKGHHIYLSSCWACDLDIFLAMHMHCTSKPTLYTSLYDLSLELWKACVVINRSRHSLSQRCIVAWLTTNFGQTGFQLEQQPLLSDFPPRERLRVNFLYRLLRTSKFATLWRKSQSLVQLAYLFDQSNIYRTIPISTVNERSSVKRRIVRFLHRWNYALVITGHQSFPLLRAIRQA